MGLTESPQDTGTCQKFEALGSVKMRRPRQGDTNRSHDKGAHRLSQTDEPRASSFNGERDGRLSTC